MVYLKSNILGLLIVVFSLPFWFFCYDLLRKEIYDGIPLLYAALFLSLYLISVSTLLLFVERTSLFFVPLAVSITPIFYFFGVSFSTGIAAFVYMVCIVQAFIRVRWEKENRLQFRAGFLLHQGVPLILTALTLLIAAGYFVISSRAPEHITIRGIISPSLATAILDRITPFTTEQLGIGLNTRLTVDEYIQEQLKITGVDISKFSVIERNTILAEMRLKLSESIARDSSSFTLVGDEKMGDVFYVIIERKSENLLAPYQRYIPFAFAIGFFLFLRTVAFPYGWVIIGLTSVVILLLRRLQIVKQIEEQTVREHLEWT